MNITITGASGFIGRQLLRHLSYSEHDDARVRASA